MGSCLQTCCPCLFRSTDDSTGTSTQKGGISGGSDYTDRTTVSQKEVNVSEARETAFEGDRLANLKREANQRRIVEAVTRAGLHSLEKEFTESEYYKN